MDDDDDPGPDDATDGASDDAPSDESDTSETSDATERRIEHGAVQPMPVERRRTVKRQSGRQSLGGAALMGAVAMGLQEVFDPQDREPVIEEVTSGEPDPDAAVDLLLVPDAPRRSRARVRPWLLPARLDDCP